MIQLKRGSFRGIEYNFEDTTRKSGRKSVFHTFPNSDIVLAEDLGRAPRVISMNIIIHGTPDTKDVIRTKQNVIVPSRYYSRRDAIIQALEKKGPGNLVHPTYGTIKVQLEGAYSISENLKSMNVAKISVSFVMINEGDFLPTDGFSGIAIPNDSVNINNTVSDILDKGIDIFSVEGWNSIAENVNNLIEFGTDVLRFVTDPDLFNSLSVAIRNLTTFYVPNLAILGETLTGLFDQIEVSISDPRDLLGAYSALFDYNDDVIEALPDPTTVELQTLAESEEVFRLFVQTEALTHATNAAVNVDFTTEDDLDTIAKQIFDQQDKVLELPSSDTELYNQIQSQRVSFNSFVDQQNQAILRVVEVQVRNESLTTIVHRYYGDLDNYDLIKDLNAFENPSLIQGTVKVVTNV